ncbi:MAG: hypothetical protein ABW176_17150 [Candidatus Thiodiazotropha endolucinida]
MEAMLTRIEQLTALCNAVDTAEGIDGLTAKLKALMPEYPFECVLSRGNWHRLGGVVDGDYRQVSDNISQWAERESQGDVDNLVSKYLGLGYFATRLAGNTHYFTAPTGKGPHEFLQLEIEELQQVVDRPLVERDWFPDSVEEFLDPLDYPRLEPEPVGKSYYRFRRLTPIDKLVTEKSAGNDAHQTLQRFFNDWMESSACESEPFCRHWVLALREFTDRDSGIRINAKPVSVFAGQLPELPVADRLSGSALANAVHGYDRVLGYPFAWYFMMLGSTASNYALADAVLQDQMGAYDYLPKRDLKVLREWEAKPYGV